MKAMTAAEFVAYWMSQGEDGTEMSQYQMAEESIAEHETQFDSETALFGDAGVGQGYRLNAMRAEFARVTRQLQRLGAIRR